MINCSNERPSKDSRAQPKSFVMAELTQTITPVRSRTNTLVGILSRTPASSTLAPLRGAVRFGPVRSMGVCRRLSEAGFDAARSTDRLRGRVADLADFIDP